MTLARSLDDITEIINKTFSTRSVPLKRIDTVAEVINMACSIRNIYTGSLAGDDRRKARIQKIHGFDELVDLAIE